MKTAININSYKLEKEIKLAKLELEKINNQIDSLSNYRILLINSIKKLQEELKHTK